MSDDTIQSSIEKAAIDGVSSVSTDGTSVSSMSMDERIKADSYLKSQSARARNHMGLTFRKLEPGGCG